MVSVDQAPQFSHFLARSCSRGLNLRTQEFLHIVEARVVEQQAGENGEGGNTKAYHNRENLTFRSRQQRFHQLTA